MSEIKTYSELDRIDLTPVWIGNQERGDGTEFAMWNLPDGRTLALPSLHDMGIYPVCVLCNAVDAFYDDGLCASCYKQLGQEKDWEGRL